ncbi:alpha-L-rhamnosidase [Devosia yakushimensis]|uniref:alpha-L-rhamnosidase n=1 Tax=Devosia yakushimensis TaxID=470028 RepID=A0ABQ5UJA8_9HYPH|nr:alpha-L-rhamnosidase [Devosia yakushimensis]GLQ12128.1 alpha-L-rhamnosidase [Devosia yakushimensis]
METRQYVGPIEWVGKMIVPLTDRGEGGPASQVTREFDVELVRGNEILRVSACGLYRAFINGQRVGEDVLTPGWTTYDARLSYQVYHVAHLLKEGRNTITIWIGDGWYRSPLMWMSERRTEVWGTEVSAIAEIRSGEDFSKVLVATDEHWLSGQTPVRKSQIYFGEIFDATFASRPREGVRSIVFDTRKLILHECAPVRELSPLDPIRQWRDTDGRTIYDFGQNAAGYVRVSIAGETAGEILIEHAEILDERGEFYNVNYRSAEAISRVQVNERGLIDYSPIFTYFGFRYARVTASDGARITKIQSVPISSVPDATAGFSCGNELVNRFFENAIWSHRSNFIDVPIDCPQRDERLGYSGDAQVFAAAACYLADSEGILTKFVRDLMVDQALDGAISHTSPHVVRMKPGNRKQRGSMGWGDAITIIPWRLYVHYGNEDIIAEAFPAMVRWIDFAWSLTTDGVVRPPNTPGMRGYCLGDWLQPAGTEANPLPTIGKDAIATIYLFISLTIGTRVADILGETDTGARLEQMRSAVETAFRREFITASGRLKHDDQTSYALALLHDLVPPELVEATTDCFRQAIGRTGGRLGTGFLGTPALLPALSKVGEGHLAASVFLQEEVPGWLYQVKRGATTIWERWDGVLADGTLFDPDMNSFNHYAFGAVCDWLLESVAGFRPDPKQPGFEHIIYSPTIIPELSPVTAHYDSVRGKISADWTVVGEDVRYEITVPDGTRGTLRLSRAHLEPVVDGVSVDAGREVVVTPGHHVVTFRLSNHGR